MSDEATEERETEREDEAADGPAVPQEGEAGPHAGAGHGEPDKSAKKTEDAPAPSARRSRTTRSSSTGSESPPSGSSCPTTCRGAALLLPRGPGPGPGQARRRQDARLLRLPRAAQRRARPLQGRHPLPPRGGPRRGARARRADDLEDGHREHPLRRREGRRERRPEQAREPRAPGGRALVHGQDREGARTHARHPGARRRHERPGDGLADGRVRKAPRPHARVRDRQADRARGLLRARGRHRPRRGARVPGGRAGDRPRPRRDALRGPGLRQRRLLGGAADAGARRDAWSASPTPAARSPTEDGIDAEKLAEHVREGGTRGRLRRRAPSRSTPTSCSRSSATCSSPRRSAG